jgi:menaquinone-specific isochorismate synthase
MSLVARTRRLDHDVDLLTVAGPDGVILARDGIGLAGRGTALEIEVDDVLDAQAELAAIEVDDEVGGPGTGPVAFGAWQFLPGPGRRLYVPEVVVGRDDRGSRWVTTIGDVDPTPVLLDVDPTPVLPDQVSVRTTQSAEDWCDAVVAGRDAVRAGDLRKVVLARELVVETDRPIDRSAVLRRLAAGFPGCMLAAVDGFVCASPETLVARHGDVVRSHPLAGTAPRGGDPTADARLAAGLLASAKDRAEHQVTIDFVHEILLPWCSFLDEEAEPSVVGVANVQHLGTMVEGRLSDPAPSVLELVDALHPTPAVAGDPRDDALALIAKLEPGDRGRYAGPVGWVDAAGNGRWAVGIRSAELSGAEARLWAGVGIVADSDPLAELEETRAKAQAMLGALVRL